jgi:hypothetical protein
MSLNMSEGQIWMCLISGHKVRLFVLCFTIPDILNPISISSLHFIPLDTLNQWHITYLSHIANLACLLNWKITISTVPMSGTSASLSSPLIGSLPPTESTRI